MRSGITVGRILGVRLILHPSWFVIFFLVVVFVGSVRLPGDTALSPGARWFVAVIVALLFFASVVVHEMAHALVARRRGVRVKEIVLFIFGGAAQLEQETPDATTEAIVAGVGPLSSVVLGLGFLGAGSLLASADSEPFGVAAEASRKLGTINLLLAGFNLIPGFPMDGGRLLRALIWRVRGDFVQATRIATLVGRGFAYLLIAYGFFTALDRDPIGGIWLAFIGWFLNQAAEQSYRRVAVEKLMEGISVGDVMEPEAAAVGPNLTLDTLVEEHLLSGRATFYPVVHDDVLVGTVELDQVRRIAREDWPQTRVTDVMSRHDGVRALTRDQPLWAAVMQFEESAGSAIPVVDPDDRRRLLGVVTRDNVFRALRARAQLGA